MKKASIVAIAAFALLPALPVGAAASTIQDTLSACPQSSLGFSLEGRAQALVSRADPTSQDIANSLAMRGKSASIWRSCARNATDPLLHDVAMVEALGNETLSSKDVSTVSAAVSGLKKLSQKSGYAVVRKGAAQFAAMGEQVLQTLQRQP